MRPASFETLSASQSHHTVVLVIYAHLLPPHLPTGSRTGQAFMGGIIALWTSSSLTIFDP